MSDVDVPPTRPNGDPTTESHPKEIILKCVVEKAFVPAGVIKPGSRASVYFCSKITVVGADHPIAQECLIPEAMIKKLRHQAAMLRNHPFNAKGLHEKLVEWAMFNIPPIGPDDLNQGIIVPGQVS